MPTAGLSARDALGRYGERLAARYLTDRGLTILERNWRCSFGELDIVARDGACLVVCEVKTRRTSGFGSPVEAVTAVKAMRLRRLAAQWLAERHEESVRSPAGDLVLSDVRVDVVGVLRPRHGPAVLEHLIGVA